MGGALGKSGSFVLDHSMDNIPLSKMDDENLRHGSISTLSTKGYPTEEDQGLISLYETKAERKSRRRSLNVAFVTMFVMSTGFSIVLTGVWPYMQTLNKDLGKESVGWVVAANPLGQVLASPLIGYWGNKAGSVRIPCIVTVIVYILGNAMYSMLEGLNSLGPMASYYGMIVSRFIVGMSSANVALMRSYVAAATTLKERSVAISVIAASQALGFVVGPVIQAILTALVPDSVDTGISWLRWDKFTSCSWIAAVMGFINFIILTPCVFKEKNIAAKEMAMMESENENLKLPKPDITGVMGIMFSNFLSLFIFTLLETLAEPFVQDEYGWSDDMALIIVGISLAVAGIWAVAMFTISGYLCRKYDERKVLLFIGFPLLIVGSFLFLPWGSATMPMKCPDNTTTISSTATMLPSTTTFSPSTTVLSSSLTTTLPEKNIFSSTLIRRANPTAIQASSPLSTMTDSLYGKVQGLSSVVNIPQSIGKINSDKKVDKFIELHFSPTEWYEDMQETPNPINCSDFGCPYDEQPWCEYTPQLPIPQLVIAFLIIMSGYPVCQTISQAIYSKMLGPRPQGVWMGILTGIGGLSRILGPIFVTYVYTFYGTYLTFGVLTAAMSLALIELSIIYKKLVPMKIPSRREVNAYDGPAAKDKF
ncbi:major facilitator superfamily domain-containing protein 8-like [Palaemon carinicauda]|uniref:major facilitator superfamily domain-containing protein 8-like n=1 Tax=Palaemon carinicauda TaxID=392227 RepID=UPI0035B5D543